VILSVAKYYSPDGKSIQDNGVTPNVAQVEADVAADDDDTTPDNPEPPAAKPGVDELLNRAVKTVNAK
jgi:C-terminal processing protease CtpA/Prc